MASVTIDAEYALKTCKARLDEIEKQFQAEKEEWFARQRKRMRKRGAWPFRYNYYPTEGELEAAFSGADGDSWYWPEYGLRRGSGNERFALKKIMNAAEVSMLADDKNSGDGKVTLSGDELDCFNRLTEAKAA